MRKLFFLLIVISVGVMGCANATPTPAPTAVPTVASVPLPAGVVFRVVAPDGTATDITRDNLKFLPPTSITLDGKSQEGPALNTVLGFSGITGYQSVSVTGADGTIDLKPTDVTWDTILEVDGQGLVNVISPTMAKEKQMHGITKIVVK